MASRDRAAVSLILAPPRIEPGCSGRGGRNVPGDLPCSGAGLTAAQSGKPEADQLVAGTVVFASAVVLYANGALSGCGSGEG